MTPRISDCFPDVCCGTGTIGIFLAPFVKRVFGIEVVEPAVLDAKDNAKLNGGELPGNPS